MDNHHFSRIYSESDLNKLINNGQKKAEYINRIIDTDIHINMVSESNSPLKEKPKYMRNSYNINANNFYEKNKEKYINNPRTLHYNNKNIKGIYNNDYNDRNNENYNYNYNYELEDDNLNNSLNLNKPFHCERRHFPLINNKGNFFKNITPFLIGNTQRLNLIRNQDNNNRYNINHYNNKNKNNMYLRNDNNIKRYQCEKLRKSSSMANIPINNHKIRKNIIQNDNKIDFCENSVNSMGNYEKRYKYYNPRRYDYEGSRYGDKTYNYYLNSPMRGDISADWKFPPLYYYNYISKENY